MFGFGKNKKIDDMIVSSISVTLAVIVGGQQEAVTLVQSLLGETKEKLKAQNIDPYATHFGDKLVQNETLLAPRLAAGLSKRDLLQHWNRPICQIYTESSLRSTLALIFIRHAELQGEDPGAASRQWCIQNPIYGSPENHDLSSPALVGLKSDDAPLFEEFQARIATWSLKNNQERVSKLISEHGTYNAMVRALVAAGEL